MTIAFTGYRAAKMPRGAETSVIRALLRLLPRLVEQGYDTFLSGMADGFDMWAAEAVLAIKEDFPAVRLVAVVPFRGQADAFLPNTKRRYDAILEQADKVIMLSESYHAGVYHRRNDYLVANCSLMVCYYDGKPGGTQYTVNQARSCNKEIYNLQSTIDN